MKHLHIGIRLHNFFFCLSERVSQKVFKPKDIMATRNELHCWNVQLVDAVKGKGGNGLYGSDPGISYVHEWRCV